MHRHRIRPRGGDEVAAEMNPKKILIYAS